MPKFQLVDQAAEPQAFVPTYSGISAFTKAALETHSTYVFFLAVWTEFQRRSYDATLTASERSIWERRATQINEILRSERDEGRNDL